ARTQRVKCRPNCALIIVPNMQACAFALPWTIERECCHAAREKNIFPIEKFFFARIETGEQENERTGIGEREIGRTQNANERFSSKWCFNSVSGGVEQLQAARVRVNRFAVCNTIFLCVILKQKFSKMICECGSNVRLAGGQCPVLRLRSLGARDVQVAGGA